MRKIVLISDLQSKSTEGARWCAESNQTLKRLKQPGHDAFGKALEVTGTLAMAGLGLVSVAGWAETGKELAKVAAKEATDLSIDMVTDWGVKINQMKM